jgi:hypothetical protein
VLLPADQALHELPLLVAGVPGLDHPAHAEAAHRLADRDRRQVARHVVDPGPVGGVQRDPLGADERLALADLRELDLLELEGLGADPPRRALAQSEATIHWHGATLSPGHEKWS